MAFTAGGVYLGRQQTTYDVGTTTHNPTSQTTNYDVTAGSQHHETRKTEMTGLRGQLENIQENSPDYLKLLNRYHELENEEKAEQISVQKAIKDGPPAELNPTEQEKYKSDLGKLAQDISKTLKGDDDGKPDGLIDIGKGRYLRTENLQTFTTTYNCDPASPVPPGFRADNQVVAGPNHFSLSLEGPDPDLAVGGTHEQQEAQRDKTTLMAAAATTSYESRLLPGDTRIPSDGQVADILGGLNPNPPVGKDGVDVTHGIYQSSIPNASADEVFNHWVQNPNQVFNAGGMEIRPPVTTLVNGRYMLETGGTNAPPTWLPVEITVNEADRSIHIQTLDGHVLRGEQTFSFRDDGCGGSRIVQEARFQAGSQLAGDLQQFLPISQGQHTAWQNAHRESYEQFNGNKDYKGIGMPYVDPLTQTRALTKQVIDQIKLDPDGAADGGVDMVGDVGNLALDAGGKGSDILIDGAGTLARKTLDSAGLPGGVQVEQVADTTGNFVEGTLDTAGDWVEARFDKAGDKAGAAVRFLNPFD